MKRGILNHITFSDPPVNSVAIAWIANPGEPDGPNYPYWVNAREFLEWIARVFGDDWQGKAIEFEADEGYLLRRTALP